MEKLTLEIAMKYPNAKLISDRNINYNNLEAFIRGKYYALWLKTDDSIHISDYKLILRPIESLTEEENKMVDKLSYDKVPYEFLSRINYLRSINIDIDGLEEKGLAVYE